jgi:hypothetical protein
MPESICGLVGVCLGAIATLAAVFLTHLGQRWLWRTQEAIKAYAAMFPAGERETRILESLSLGAAFGDNDMIERADRMLPAYVDSRFAELLAIEPQKANVTLSSVERQFGGFAEAMESGGRTLGAM